jgi:hypothetical protein
MNDDLYLRDGETYTNGTYYPDVPQEQVDEEVKQKGIIASSYPIMNDVADWFDSAIADSKDMTNIDLTVTEINGVKVSMSVSAEAKVLAYHLLTQALQDKKAEFAEFGKGRE